MTSLARIAPAVSSYADRLHAALGDGHHVASPLGAWLVLALAAPAAHGDDRAALTGALGMDVEDAAATAGDLLVDPPAAVPTAAAFWHRVAYATPALAAWERALPARVERGPVPDQTGADAWARRNTLDLIERFPLELTGDTALVLASALATRVSWVRPFELVPAAELGPGEWANGLGQVLRTPAFGHDAFIASTARAGTVAAHTATATEGLAVTSVVAPENVAPADVLAAAHEIALAADPAKVSLFDLDLGEGALWTITEREAPMNRPRDERCAAVLPAWEAQSDHGLDAPSLGFGAAGRALIGLLTPGDYRCVAKQAAMARYSRTGFEAAAVTGSAVQASAVFQQRTGVLREAVLRFGHPYAVVAVCRGGRWDGLPVFSAWVSAPSPAD